MSSTALLFVFEGLLAVEIPLKSSESSGSPSLDPPHRVTNASSPRTLMPRLLVLLKTAATVGKSSFFMVEKSNVARMVGRHPKDLSTIA